MPIPPECTGLANELAELQQAREAAKNELDHAAPGQKPAAAAEVRALGVAIAAKQRMLGACIAAHQLVSTLSGTAAIWFEPAGSAGSSRVAVTGTVTFLGADRCRVQLTMPTIPFGQAARFSAFGISFDVSVTATLNGPAEGAYDRAAQRIDIAASFRLDPSVSGFLSFLLSTQPGTLVLTPPGLTTGTVPSAIAAQGQVRGTALDSASGMLTLVAAGIVRGGLLDGKLFEMEIRGTLQPVP